MAATQKSSKKRPAAAQSGPIAKKVHLDKPAKEDTGAEKKRSRPITLSVQEENSESEDRFDELDGGEDDVGLDATLDADGMDVGSSNAPPKDPNGMFVGLVLIFSMLLWFVACDFIYFVAFNRPFCTFYAWTSLPRIKLLNTSADPLPSIPGIPQSPTSNPSNPACAKTIFQSSNVSQINMVPRAAEEYTHTRAPEAHQRFNERHSRQGERYCA